VPGFDWRALVAAKDAEISRLNGIYERMLVKQGVEIVRGYGQLGGPHEVHVGDRVMTAKHILIATGCRSSRPKVPGAALAWTSDDLFDLDELPASITLVGGGYIAVEFASILAGLGVQTHLTYRGPLFLRGFDDEVRQALAEEMAHKDIDLRFDFGLDRIEQRDNGLAVVAPDGQEVVSDAVLLATGRAPNIAGLGLKQVGVRTAKDDGIVVDADYRTSVPSIFAVGDVIQRFQLTPVALAEGMVVAHSLFGEGWRKVGYDTVPTAVFCNPNVAVVGLTEEEARARFPTGRVYSARFRPLKHTLSGRRQRVLVKVVVDGATDRVVGCHMIGPDAGEVIQGLAVAMRAGATKEDFDSTLGIHPTTAEEFVTMREVTRSWDDTIQA
jgi:glutathione reductase (NADPH)